MARVRLSKEDRKNQILNCSMKIFIKKGYSKTTMADICKKSKISKGGLYHHYPNKESIFFDLVKMAVENRKDIIKDYLANNKDMKREDFIINLLLEKILDKNDYSYLFVNLLIESKNNKSLSSYYTKIANYIEKDFIEFCKKENLTEYIQLTNSEFGVFVNSLILGSSIFDKMYDEDKFRKMLREILIYYFKYLKIL